MRVRRVLALVAVLTAATGVSGLVSLACDSPPADLFKDAPDAAPQDDVVVPDAPFDAGPLLFEVSDNGVVDFGTADCAGIAPMAKSITLKNVGPVPIVYRAALDSTLSFALTGGASGVVSQGATATITVVAQPVAGAAKAGEVLRATLTLSDSYGHAPLKIPVSIIPEGGALVATPVMVAFGDVPLFTQANEIPLTITNVGNKAVQVVIPQPADKSVSIAWAGGPGPVSIEPGASLEGAVARFLPTTPGAHGGEVTVIPSGALCNSGAQTLTITGTGTGTLPDAGPGPDAGDASHDASDASDAAGGG